MNAAHSNIKLNDARIDPEEVERFKQQRAAELEPQILRPVGLDEMITSYPTLREPIVDGLLRAGETANIIASPKVGKSFLAANLACSIAKGSPWFGHDVAQGHVLILDNELHPETLASRLHRIATEMQLEPADRARIETISLRGRLLDINNFGWRVAIEPGKYSAVLLDALYRTVPPGANENANADMMAIYNRLDEYAATWGAAIVVVHHSSKGDQSAKGITDMGAGAGAISRAADTHIAIRPHETEGLAVMEAVTRSFKSPEPISIKFNWPLWSAVTVAPAVKKLNPGGSENKRAEDKADAEAMLAKIPFQPEEIQQNDLFDEFGYGVPRCTRLVGKLIHDKRVKREKRALKKSGRKYVFYSRIKSDSNSNSNSGFDSGNENGIM